MPPQDHSIPLFYRLTFNWFEPIMAFGGAIQAYFWPHNLVAIATPNSTYESAMHPFFTQIAGGWVLLAFNDAVTLRMTQDVRIWASILTAGILSDLMYSLSLYEDLGAATFWNPAAWDFNMWFTNGTTVLPFLIKVAFVLRIGLGNAWEEVKSKRS
jgi:hypothetical protein